jgi:tetratricopeptide (TPR) repeat protein
VFTDHRIAIYSAQDLAGLAAPAAPSPAGGKGELVAWHPPAPAFEQRNLGLADIFTGERMQSFPLVQQGYGLLLGAYSMFPDDPAVATAMGVVQLGEGHASAAQTLFEKVIQIAPNSAPGYVHSALAWQAMHNDAKAIECLNKALKLDPLVQQPYRNLAAIYVQENNPAMVSQTYDRFLKAFPQSLEAQSDVEKSERHAPLPTQGASGVAAH